MAIFPTPQHRSRPAFASVPGVPIVRTGIAKPIVALYAYSLYSNPGATLEGLREAVTTLEETERIARRVLGGAHPITAGIKANLQNARAALRARETPSGSA